MEEIFKGVESGDGKVRGEAIKAINAELDGLFATDAWEDAASFLQLLPSHFESPERTCGIFARYFDQITTIENSDPRYTTSLALSIERLLNGPYRMAEQERQVRLGRTCEFLSQHTNDINELIYLKKAVVAYTRASQPENAERLSKIKQGKIATFAKMGLGRETIPEEIVKDIYKASEEVKMDLLSRSFESIISILSLHDPFRILFSKGELANNGQDALSIFEQLPGIVVSTQITQDGRQLNQNDSDIDLRALRRGFEVWDIQAQSKLVCFGELLAELLDSDHPEHQHRVEYLARFLSYASDGSVGEGRFGLCIVLDFLSRNHLGSLSVSIPFMERSIRKSAQRIGINPVRQETDSSQPEMFRVLNFLKDSRIRDFFSEKLCDTLEACLLMDDRGFGLNLRNDVAHGVLGYDDYHWFNTHLVLYLLLQVAGKGVPP